MYDDVLIAAPSDRVLRGRVTAETGQNNVWRAEFIPREIGEYLKFYWRT